MAQAMVSSINPTHGGAGTSVTITGTEFGSVQGGNCNVTLGGIPVTITSWSDTSIVFTVPSDSVMGDVLVNIAYQAYGGVFSNP